MDRKKARGEWKQGSTVSDRNTNSLVSGFNWVLLQSLQGVHSAGTSMWWTQRAAECQVGERTWVMNGWHSVREPIRDPHGAMFDSHVRKTTDRDGWFWFTCLCEISIFFLNFSDRTELFVVCFPSLVFLTASAQTHSGNKSKLIK